MNSSQDSHQASNVVNPKPKHQPIDDSMTSQPSDAVDADRRSSPDDDAESRGAEPSRGESSARKAEDNFPESSSNEMSRDDFGQRTQSDDGNGQPSHEAAESHPDVDSDGGEDPVARMQAEVDDLQDKYMRSVAEMENLRRRTSKERSDLLKYGLENFFKDMLPVLDSLKTALPDDASTNPAEDGESFRQGMAMVKKQLLDTLQRHGLTPVEAAGALFDPNVHQAIQRLEDGEVDQETIAEEFQRGYTLHGRLLRPAMVSVKVPGATAKKSENSD